MKNTTFKHLFQGFDCVSQFSTQEMVQQDSQTTQFQFVVCEMQFATLTKNTNILPEILLTCSSVPLRISPKLCSDSLLCRMEIYILRNIRFNKFRIIIYCDLVRNISQTNISCRVKKKQHTASWMNSQEPNWILQSRILGYKISRGLQSGVYQDDFFHDSNNPEHPKLSWDDRDERAGDNSGDHLKTRLIPHSHQLNTPFN